MMIRRKTHCFQSVVLLALLVAGCASTEGPRFEASRNNPPEYTTVYIYRPNMFRAGGTATDVYIDDFKIALVKNAGYTKLLLKPGTYTIAVRNTARQNRGLMKYQFTVFPDTKRIFIRVWKPNDVGVQLAFLAVDVILWNAIGGTPVFSGDVPQSSFVAHAVQEPFALKELEECRYFAPHAYNPLVVLDLSTGGPSEENMVHALADIVSKEVSSTQQFTIIGHEAVDTALSKTSIKGESLVERARSAGRFLGAGKVLAAKVNRGREGCYSVLALVDVASGKVDAMNDNKSSCEQDELASWFKTAAREMTGIETKQEPKKAGVSDGPPAGELKTAETFTDPSTGMQFVFVKGGCYLMGGAEGGRTSDCERSLREICVTDFYIGKFEVTQKEWGMVMGSNPSVGFRGDDYPVNNVSWDDIQQFIMNFKLKAADSYRLPTEAEWEYAARSGGKKETWAGTSSTDTLNEYAWYKATVSHKGVHKVGTKKSNGLGLYDMSGNAKEWVQDVYAFTCEPVGSKDPDEEERHVMRGGSWSNSPDRITTMYRDWDAHDSFYNDFGFRVVRGVGK